MNLLENEDLAWERFEKAVTNEDVAVCYDMSLKEFEHFDVHDLFKDGNHERKQRQGGGGRGN